VSPVEREIVDFVSSHYYRRFGALLSRKKSTWTPKRYVCVHIAALTRQKGSGAENEMRTYLVSYDLDKPDQDYHKLIKELERLGAVKILYSEWIMKGDWTAVQLRDHLRSFIGASDMLLVAGLTGEAAWTSLMVSNDRFKQSIAA